MTDVLTRASVTLVLMKTSKSAPFAPLIAIFLKDLLALILPTSLLFPDSAHWLRIPLMRQR
jgi:hypothetical protein